MPAYLGQSDKAAYRYLTPGRCLPQKIYLENDYFCDIVVDRSACWKQLGFEVSYLRWFKMLGACRL